jgi:tetratricopeptide (TPR) repeat protein
VTPNPVSGSWHGRQSKKNQHPDPEWGSFAYEQLSWILPAAGQFENAIRQLSSLIQTDPTGPFFRMERSILYSRTGQFEYAKRDIESLADGRYRYQAQAFYYYWRDQPERVIEFHERICAISDVHPNYPLYTYCLIGDFDAAMERYTRAVNSLLRGYIDFGPLRAFTRARLPEALVNQLEQHPDFASLLEKEGIDDAWCKELMDSVNELTKITGIRINQSAFGV